MKPARLRGPCYQARRPKSTPQARRRSLFSTFLQTSLHTRAKPAWQTTYATNLPGEPPPDPTNEPEADGPKKDGTRGGNHSNLEVAAVREETPVRVCSGE